MVMNCSSAKGAGREVALILGGIATLPAMHRREWIRLTAALLGLGALSRNATAQVRTTVVNLPTRPGVTLRLLVLVPPQPRAVALLYPGGQGALLLTPSGDILRDGAGLLVRSRQLLLDQGLLVVLVDVPSDRQLPPYLAQARQSDAQLADAQALIAWIRSNSALPVWMLGFGEGTQSVVHAASQLEADQGPDGLVLLSPVLVDPATRALPQMRLDQVRVPVLVAQHQLDECPLSPFSAAHDLMELLRNAPRRQLLAFQGGTGRAHGCEAFAFHGFGGLEPDLMQQVAAWMLAR